MGDGGIDYSRFISGAQNLEGDQTSNFKVRRSHAWLPMHHSVKETLYDALGKNIYMACRT